MNDLTFGFRHKSAPVDLIDNEYLHIDVYKEIKYPDNKKVDKVDIGIHHCQQTSHLTNIYSPIAIEAYFGKLHCPNKLEGDLKYFKGSF